MNASITGTRSELGGILARRRAGSATANIHINVAGQQANSLLHDGHGWKDFARTALAGTRRAMRSARADGAPMLVHASFAFVHAVEHGTRLAEPLRSSVDAILECEALALSGPVPACVVRLGYLYGRRVRSARLSHRLSSRPAVLVRSAQGIAIPPPSVRCRFGLARRGETTKRGKDPLRHGRSRGFVHAADGCVRASGRQAQRRCICRCFRSPSRR